MKTTAAAMLAAALIASPATAHADDVRTADQIVAVMAELTDPNIPAVNKDNIVTPGFSPDEAGTIDDHLNRMRRQLPINFFVTNIQPAPNNLAGATVETQSTNPRPIVLVDQGGHCAGFRRVSRPHMSWTKFSVTIALAAALIASPATAYADPPPPPPPNCESGSNDPACQPTPPPQPYCARFWHIMGRC